MTDWIQRHQELILGKGQKEQGEEQADSEELGEKGGPGSGHFGHAGRPGKRGGSVSGSVAVSVATGRTAAERQQAAAGGDSGEKPKPINRELDGWSDLPKDLTKLTQQQHKDVIKFLAKKPLKELRRRQDLVTAQQEMAHQQGNDFAKGNLNVMWEHLMNAVMAREFPETADWLND
ncbi:MAG TPA: hypothetical protein VM537_04675 [Anaerolineae bacterium]|nr:hypothetical protein [Anaerolineae bacterium]